MVQDKFSLSPEIDPVENVLNFIVRPPRRQILQFTSTNQEPPTIFLILHHFLCLFVLATLEESDVSTHRP